MNRDRPRPENPQHRVLADFLRTHRARLTPSTRGRRRTPGLRREEVAQLSGISATWYTWMEQGRDVSVSPAALNRLAKALQLTAAERAYLFEIAGKRDPKAPTHESMAAPPDLSDAVAAIRTPAYVLDGLWNAVAWNKAATNLFVGWLGDDQNRNLLRYIFRSPSARRLIGDWEDRARRVLAEFRVDYGKRMDDPAMQSLVDDLRRKSAFFAETWDEHLILSREGGERTFDHPADGQRTYRQATFTFATRPEFKLVILTPLRH
ncbi:MAG: XRE family transcriptional regulator [Rhodospirillaceae bacterium]|nr:MAG: XRE family transcriptional regulator [Rhodospirillaceae bacterium]